MIWCATTGSCSRRAEPEDNGVKDVRSGAEGMGENGGPVDWVLVPAANGGIMGVASSSKRAPLKTAGFDQIEKAFADAKAYSDWQFTFAPGVVRRKTP